MADDVRIEELRRRIRKDPASLAFAQLAEELRRARRYLEAVAVCRAGLDMYPGYLSARVTLGRCFIELNRLDDAERELEQVREVAPENLAAVRALAEIRERRGADEVRLKPDATYDAAMPEVRLKPDTTYDRATHDRATPEVRLEPAPSARPSTPLGATWGQARSGRAVAGPDVTYDGATFEVRLKPDTTYDRATPEVRLKPDATYDWHTRRTLAALEGLLAAIHVTRASRRA